MENNKDIDNKKLEVEESENPVNDYVCSVIRRLRIERRWRVQDMARRTGIPLGSYSCLETGRYRINLENLYRILSALQTSVCDVWPVEAALDTDGLVTREAICTAVKEARRKQPPRPGLEDILEAVCLTYGLEREEMHSRSRRRLTTEARHVAAQLVRETPHLSLSELSRQLNRHASNFSHFVRRIARMPPDRRSDYNWNLKQARRLLKKRVSLRNTERRKRRSRRDCNRAASTQRGA